MVLYTYCVLNFLLGVATVSNLLNLIEIYRNEMFELADKYGPTSEETVECSQQLDLLLNILMEVEKKKELTM